MEWAGLVLFVSLVIAALLLLWFGLFETRRPRRRVAMFVAGLVAFGLAVVPVALGLVLTAQ